MKNFVFLLGIFFMFLKTITAQEVIISENFDNGIPDAWSVKSNENKTWEAKSYKEYTYIIMSAYAGKGKPRLKVFSELISPDLNLSQKECKLKFSFADAFFNGQPLRVEMKNKAGKTIKEISENYWKKLINNKGFYDNNYEETEWIPLPKKDNVYLVFVYDSKNGKISTTIQLSQIDVWCTKLE